MGNLLENAVEACHRETGGQKFIKVRVKQGKGFMLLILLDNTCKTTTVFENGIPLSSKREGPGIGTASIREIAARYHGTVQFEQKDGIFYTSVSLKNPQN